MKLFRSGPWWPVRTLQLLHSEAFKDLQDFWRNKSSIY